MWRPLSLLSDEVNNYFLTILAMTNESNSDRQNISNRTILFSFVFMTFSFENMKKCFVFFFLSSCYHHLSLDLSCIHERNYESEGVSARARESVLLRTEVYDYGGSV